MQLGQRLQISNQSPNQRPLLTLERVLDREGYPTTYVAEASDQRSKITGRTLSHFSNVVSLFHEPMAPTKQQQSFQLLLAITGPQDTLIPLSIHEDIVSVCHFLNQHAAKGHQPKLYRMTATEDGTEDNKPINMTISQPFNLLTEDRFQTTDKYDPTKRTGQQTISTPHQPDAPWAILQPKHHSIKVDAALCEPPPHNTTLLPIPGTEQTTPFTLMLRNRNTKEPLSLHPTTESLMFFAKRLNDAGKVLELVNAKGETIYV